MSCGASDVSAGVGCPFGGGGGVHKKRTAGVIASCCDMYAGDLRRIREVESPSVSGGDLKLVFAALRALDGVAAARAGTAVTAD